jgi:hypothetical protein
MPMKKDERRQDEFRRSRAAQFGVQDGEAHSNSFLN